MLCVVLMSGTAYAQGSASAQAQISPPSSPCTTSVHVPPFAPPKGANPFRAAPAPADLSQVIKVEKVKDDLYLIHNVQNTLSGIGQFGSNVIVYLTDDGIILIDSKNAMMHNFLVSEIRSISQQPIRYLVLTHNHLDHAGGAAALQRMGVTEIISTEDRALLEQDSHPPVLPQIAYHGHMQFFLGGKEVELHEVCGHTAGDSIVYLPGDRAVMSGDLVTTPDAIPQIVNYGDHGSWTDELRAMDVLAKMDFDIMIPGHGPVLTKAAFLKQRARMTAIFATVKALTRQGRSQQAIIQVLIKKYDYGFANGAGQVAGMMQEARASTQ